MKGSASRPLFSNSHGVIRMQIGSYDVHIIHAGRFKLDGGAMFGVVPKNLWSRTNPADEQNRIDMAMRLLVLKDSERCILIDTGAGLKFGEKFRAIYAIDDTEYSLFESLKRCGIATDEITDVVLTHLHFDHTGGATIRRGESVEPTFPNARFHIQRKHWEWALHPSDRDKASFIPENYLPLLKANQQHFVDGEIELFPNVHLHVVNGHTFGMQLPRIEGTDAEILFCADLFPLLSHIAPPYIMGYDLQPLETLKEKLAVLNRAVEKRMILFFEHDPIIQAATVLRTEKSFSVRSHGTLDEVLSTL